LNPIPFKNLDGTFHSKISKNLLGLQPIVLMSTSGHHSFRFGHPLPEHAAHRSETYSNQSSVHPDLYEQLRLFYRRDPASFFGDARAEKICKL
jgi:hypothetical protein